ncbi:MAG: hypothetical protein RLY43_1526 [Bacteroidota bacterium]|jgi:hypothetical protein
MRNKNIFVILLSILIILISVFIFNSNLGEDPSFNRNDLENISETFQEIKESSPILRKDTFEIFENYKIKTPYNFKAQQEDEFTVIIKEDGSPKYITIQKLLSDGNFNIYYQEDGKNKSLSIKYEDGGWNAITSDEDIWWGIHKIDPGPFIYLPWEYTENSYTHYVLANKNTIFEVTTDFSEYRDLVPEIAKAIDYINEESEKRELQKFITDPNAKSEFYMDPTEVPENIPFRDTVLKIKSDQKYDVSVYKHEDESFSLGTFWHVTAIEKERNFKYGLRETPVYYSDVIAFTIYEDVEELYESISDENERRKESNFYKLPYPGKIEEQKLFDITWKYFDFEDGYDGGYIRTYFYVKDGKAITFSLENTAMEESSNILEMTKVKYLQNLTF